MAEYWSNDDRGYKIRLWIDQVGQSIDGNSSQVRVRLSLHNGLTSFGQYNCSASVTVDGQRREWSGRPDMYNYNSMIWLIDQTLTVGHNADGSKSFGFSAAFDGSGGWSPGALRIGGNFTLTTIPRASGVTVSNVDLGSTMQINIQRAASGFTHTVRYAWGNKTGTIASNVGTSTSWNIPLNFAENIPDSVSGRGTIYVDTYSGGRKIGERSVPFTANLPSNIVPSLGSITLVDKNKTASDLIPGNTFIQIISDIAVSFNSAYGAFGSTIKSFNAEVVGKNKKMTGNGSSFGGMDFHGNVTIRATVTDSRGRTSLPKDVNISLLEYFPPSISITVYRTRQNPSTIQVSRTMRIAPLMLNGVQKNTAQLKFKVAKHGTTSYTEDNGSASGNWTTIHTLTNSSANLAGNYPSSSSYVVVAELKDRFSQNPVQASGTVSTESVIHAYDKLGRLGVGKIPENGGEGSIDAKGDIYARGNQVQQHRLTNNDGSLSQGSYQWEDGWNKQNTILGWRNGKHADNPTGVNGEWGLFQNYWLDSWKGAQFFTALGSGRHFIRVYNHPTRWQPNRWREVAYTDMPNMRNTGWQPAGYGGSYYKIVGDVLTIKYDFRGNGQTITFASIPGNIWKAPQAYMLVIANWSVAGSDNCHVQVNKNTSGFHALATGNNVLYQGQLTIML